MPSEPISPCVADATRRRFLAVFSAAGLGSTLLPGALLALAAGRASAQEDDDESSPSAGMPKITDAMVEAAASIAGLSFTPEQRKELLGNLTSQRDDLAAVRNIPLPNSVAPSLVQDPVLPGTVM